MHHSASIDSIPFATRPVALVPAYMPDSRLKDVVKSLLKSKWIQCVVCVNDGSGDSYSGIFDELSQIGVTVISHEKNLGKGRALRTGMSEILRRYPETQGVVTFDADGQHLPKDIARVAEALMSNRKTLVLGSRTALREAPLRSRFGNYLTGKVLTLFTGIRLIDTQTGLRGIPAKLIPLLLRLETSGYDFEFDMLISAGGQKNSIKEIPIQTVYIDDNESSHFNPIQDSAKIYYVLLKHSKVFITAALIDYAIFWAVFMWVEKLFISLAVCRMSAVIYYFLVSYRPAHGPGKKNVALILKSFVLVGSSFISYFGINIGTEYLNAPLFVSRVGVDVIILALLLSLFRRVRMFQCGPIQNSSRSSRRTEAV